MLNIEPIVFLTADELSGDRLRTASRRTIPSSAPKDSRTGVKTSPAAPSPCLQETRLGWGTDAGLAARWSKESSDLYLKPFALLRRGSGWWDRWSCTSARGSSASIVPIRKWSSPRCASVCKGLIRNEVQTGVFTKSFWSTSLSLHQNILNLADISEISKRLIA